MEDFLKFLLIAGVILVGIFKEVSKNNKSKKTQNKRPVPPTPSPVEVDPDATPIPEFWGRGSKVLDDFLQSLPVEQPAPKPAPKPTPKPTPKKKKEEISVAASIANSSAQDKRNTKQGSHYDHPETDNSNREDFSIHSAEEARRAIIWGEILQRKY
ncbi:ferrichrome ABC transporter substrate-binding protein [Bacteroides faecis]|nr:ferrichrome ABC transporter substrate-binding protein [Bacteroides faecis]